MPFIKYPEEGGRAGLTEHFDPYATAGPVAPSQPAKKKECPLRKHWKLILAIIIALIVIAGYFVMKKKSKGGSKSGDYQTF